MTQPAHHEALELLQRKLGYTFKNLALLEEALTHPSYSAEQKIPSPDNQRLEFLGDAVLQLVLSELLFRRFPRFQEGRLTVLRSALCNAHALARIADELDLGECVRLGKGDERAGGRTRRSTLADAFEALLAAFFIERGYGPCLKLCGQLFARFLEGPEPLMTEVNPKGALQEWTQARHHTPPTYEVLEISGPEHSPVFTVQVSIGDREVAVASAGNRKDAEKAAARLALERLKDESDES
jgi:ribonuclease-3